MQCEGMRWRCAVPEESIMALPDTTISTLDLLRRLTNHQVDFVVIGGVAANVHGSLIRSKRAAGRYKDLLAIPELEALLNPPAQPPG
jgi:hypothetical protein